MKWIEAKVVFDFNDKQLATELIADMFYELGITGVVVEAPDIEHPEDWGKDAIHPEHYAVTGYFAWDEKTSARRRVLEKNLARLEKEKGVTYKIIYADMDESDWANQWKAYFQPQKITDKIVVKPTWKKYIGHPQEIIIEIDPGMAFGTGTHPTTSMCITMIERYLNTGDSFLDVGTGSGILMVAAAKLGAARVWGTDNDAVAVEVARKNLVQNKIANASFNVVTGHFLEKIAARFDVVAANITSKSILILLEDIKKVMVKNGTFICSGLGEGDKNNVINKMKNLGFEVIDIISKKNWVSIACRSGL